MLFYERFFTKFSEELLKLRLYEKATKFKKSTTGGRFLNIFVTFSENLNLKQIIHVESTDFDLKLVFHPDLA